MKVPGMSGLDGEKFTAAIDAVRRTGAKQVQIRVDEEQDPHVWVVVSGHATRGGRPVSTGKVNAWTPAAALDPLRAMLKLAADLYDGGQCAHCLRPAGFDEGFGQMPLADHVCWVQWDPEMKVFRRACEGD